MASTAETIEVLHVDDDPQLGEMVGTYLEREDDRMIVHTAPDAETGRVTLANNDIDCIVSDYEMPGTDGIDFLEEVRETYPELPFILYTGKGSEEVAADAISAGVTDYLQKEAGTTQYTVLANRISNAVAATQSASQAERRRHRLEQLHKTVPGCVVQLDTDGRFIYANQRATDVLGVERNEVTDRTYNDPAWDIRGLDGGPIPDDQLPFRQVLETGEPLYGVEHSIEWPDGTRKVLLVNGAPLFDENGEVESVVFSLTDITERRDRERKLNQLRERAQSLMYTETKAETAQVATDIADDMIGAPLSGVHLLDEAGDVLELAGKGDAIDSRFEETPRYPRDAPEGSRAALVWQHFTQDDALVTDDLQAHDSLTEATPARSVVLQPVGVHGIFIVSSAEANAFDETDRALAEILATVLRTGLDRLEREDQLRTRQQRLERLHDATRTLMQAETREEIAEHAVRAAEDILSFSIVHVRFFDADSDGLLPVAGTDTVAEVLPERPVFTPEGDSLNWEVYESGSAEIYDDINRVEQAVDSETPVRSLLVLPLGDHGTLAAAETTPGAFDEADAFLARILATATETALDRADREAALRRQRDEQKETRTQMEFALDVTDSIIWVLDLDTGESVEYGPVDRVFGHDPSGLDEFLETVVHPADRDGVEQAFEAIISGDGEDLDVEFRTHPDIGVANWIASTGYLRERPDGSSRRVVGLATDISGRKRRETELHRQNERLDAFASIVSHDLRNPLNVAEGRLELARETCDSEDLDEVAGALDRMEMLIDDLLTLAREGRTATDLDAVSVESLVESCWEHVETGAATLIVEVDGTIEADEGRLRQVFENLFRNAIEHGGEGVTVRVGTMGSGFYVEDDGPGIPQDEREDVFDVGFSTATEGTGFGLGIVKEVVEAHGWELRVVEGRDGGARFEVTDVEGLQS